MLGNWDKSAAANSSIAVWKGEKLYSQAININFKKS